MANSEQPKLRRSLLTVLSVVIIAAPCECHRILITEVKQWWARSVLGWETRFPPAWRREGSNWARFGEAGRITDSRVVIQPAPSVPPRRLGKRWARSLSLLAMAGGENVGERRRVSCEGTKQRLHRITKKITQPRQHQFYRPREEGGVGAAPLHGESPRQFGIKTGERKGEEIVAR